MKNDNGKGEETVGKPFSHELFEWIEVFTIALTTVVILFTFVMKVVTVEGSSMMETLHEKDFLTISNLFYTPKQGDIVVLQVPALGGDHAPIIKRVIATEGQTVDINFEVWEVFVDGKLLDEDYVNYIESEFMDRGTSDSQYPLTVEEGKIFVLGDNRNNSRDSRDAAIKQVDVEHILGRVLIRLMPLDKFGRVKPNAE